MELSFKEMGYLLKQFPRIELCYEKKIYNTVLKNKNNFYLTIPKGIKHFVWFKNFKNRPCCFLLKIGRNRKSIASIYIYKSSFNTILSAGKGTIFYGTLFKSHKINFFNIEDIFYFKGEALHLFNKTQIINQMYYILDKFLKQDYFTFDHIIFGMPIISVDYDKLKNIVSNLSYDIYAIQSRNNKQNIVYNHCIKNNKEKFKTFLVKATLQTDIYELYIQNINTVEKYSNALIPTYKLSILMNSLFRNIKENKNIDFIEESDDEEDFEDVSLDKYVDLEKSYKMKCVYNNKYKLWIPIEISNEPVVHKKNL
jgi:hypothetical protein